MWQNYDVTGWLTGVVAVTAQLHHSYCERRFIEQHRYLRGTLTVVWRGLILFPFWQLTQLMVCAALAPTACFSSVFLLQCGHFAYTEVVFTEECSDKGLPRTTLFCLSFYELLPSLTAAGAVKRESRVFWGGLRAMKLLQNQTWRLLTRLDDTDLVSGQKRVGR